MELTWLDSNSWLIGVGNRQILLDPWIVGSLVFNNLPWLFKGEHTKTKSIPEKIDLILLSQGLEDHAHKPTLEQLDRNLPVVASPNATKVVESLGYQQIHTLEHEKTYTLPDELTITALPGSQIGPTLVENAYIIKDLKTNQSLYYEPHGFHSPLLKQYAPVDIVVTPIINLKIPLVGSVIQGQEEAIKLCQWLQPKYIVPTAAGGDVQFEGLLNSVLTAEGSGAQMREKLSNSNLTTQLMEPTPGEKVNLN